MNKFIDNNIVLILVVFIIVSMMIFMITSAKTQKDIDKK